ncbi:hypothetical protein D3C76_989960 [compost metagenome]
MSAPQRVDHTSFSTSSSMEEVTAELPMLAFTFTRKLRPIIIGSDSGWLILAGIIARPAATSSRTNSGVMFSGRRAPNPSPGCWWRSTSLRMRSRPMFSRIAMNSISGVTMPERA